MADPRVDRSMWEMSGPDLYEPERRYHDRRKRDRRALVLAAIAAAGMVFLAGAVAGRATATSRPSSGVAVFSKVTVNEGGNDAESWRHGTGETGDEQGLSLLSEANDPARTPASFGRPQDQTVAPPPALILDPAQPTEPATPPGNVAPDGELVVVGRVSVAVQAPAVAGPSRVSGIASYYDDPKKSGIYAAAGPALRVGDWRGRTVTVCGAVCFAVTLGDFCDCPGGRVIDLSSTAFARLAPLSRGLVSVTVTWP